MFFTRFITHPVFTENPRFSINETAIKHIQKEQKEQKYQKIWKEHDSYEEDSSFHVNDEMIHFFTKTIHEKNKMNDRETSILLCFFVSGGLYLLGKYLEKRPV